VPHGPLLPVRQLEPTIAAPLNQVVDLIEEQRDPRVLGAAHEIAAHAPARLAPTATSSAIPVQRVRRRYDPLSRVQLRVCASVPAAPHLENRAPADTFGSGNNGVHQ